MTDGGPAFPVQVIHHDGMFLRDWFAGMALTYVGYMLVEGKLKHGEAYIDEQVAEISYDIADAMLKQREVKHD